jgi:hypothetical protein
VRVDCTVTPLMLQRASEAIRCQEFSDIPQFSSSLLHVRVWE